MIDWEKNKRMHHSIFETAGNTPLVALHKISEGESVIAGKLELFNPTGSLKDRILYRMVEAAEARGDLKLGMSIIEGTTGNTGIATAMVGAVKGYPVVIVMPDGMSEERKKTILAYGAELVLTKGAESDVDIVIDKVREIKASHPGQYWEVAQFDNHDNALAHYQTTGPEIWEQTEGKIDAFVASQGTGGTVSGVARYLKEMNPDIKIYAVEPAECPILSGGDWGSHRIEGIGDGFIPQVLDVTMLDGVIQTTSDESVEMAKELARREGIFCGISSGCNVVASLKLIHKHPELKLVVTMINDNGLRYFSTELCGVYEHPDIPERDHPISTEDREKLANVQLDIIR
jgi:cysteine synthase